MPTSQHTAHFLGSMPGRYARDFDRSVVTQHAAAWLARGDRVASVTRFSSRDPGGDALCLIAEDRPGLLSMFAAAFVCTELDVVAAKVYTRRPRGGRAEAVDLFWVQRAGRDGEAARIGADDIVRLQSRLTESLQKPSAAADVFRCSEQRARPAVGPTVVKFVEDRTGTLDTLEIETEDRFGLLLSLSRALHEQRATIESCEVRTQQRRVFDVFSIAEVDGSPISAERRLEIQVAVMAAIGTQ
jgi:UTP:GlnB (protein PII) uridylyltransferase